MIHHDSYNFANAIPFMVSMVPLFILSHYYMKYIDQGALNLARKVENKMMASASTIKPTVDSPNWVVFLCFFFDKYFSLSSSIIISALKFIAKVVLGKHALKEVFLLLLIKN
ncbi:hypothetical protein [Paenibacillus luteus]|uniref:hypothetical protein n=1 Tax=Paenibacillus luteus TaxID=2545753 RepID=UPI0019D6A9B4|nr:hypothetical protein [Paenibacillus luteus]